MAARNERAPSDRGAGGGGAACLDDQDPTTKPPGKSKSDRTLDLLTALRVKYPVLAEYRPLAMHCHSDAYLRAIAAGGSRYALDGALSGALCEEHRVAAVLVLERRAEKAVKPPNPPRVLPVALLHMAKTVRRS